MGKGRSINWPIPTHQHTASMLFILFFMNSLPRPILFLLLSLIFLMWQRPMQGLLCFILARILVSSWMPLFLM